MKDNAVILVVVQGQIIFIVVSFLLLPSLLYLQSKMYSNLFHATFCEPPPVYKNMYAAHLLESMLAHWTTCNLPNFAGK